MSVKSALEEVVHVLDDIKKDPEHAAEHGLELAEAVEHLRAEHVEIPESLDLLTEDLKQKNVDDDAADDFFDNMPV